MSGITGLYFLDHRPIDPRMLQQMTDTLAHRGPDDADIWHDGPVGRGHRMLWTTPESLHERLPLISDDGQRVLTADARRRALLRVEPYQLQKWQEQEKPDALREGQAGGDCCGECHLRAFVVP